MLIEFKTIYGDKVNINPLQIGTAEAVVPGNTTKIFMAGDKDELWLTIDAPIEQVKQDLRDWWAEHFQGGGMR